MSELQKRGDETAQEYADRQELAQFLASHHVSDGNSLSQNKRQKAMDAASRASTTRISRIFTSCGGALFLIGATGWRISGGSRVAFFIIGGAILAVQIHFFFKKRREASGS